MKTFRIMLLALAAAAGCSADIEIPYVFDVENTASVYEVPEMPALDELQRVATLPDPFLFADGRRRVKKYSQWERRRAEILAEFQHYEVGHKPVTPRECISPRMSGDTLIVDINVGGEVLTLHSLITYPQGEGPFPAVIGIGFGAGSLPQHIFTDRNIAMISFPFWEVTSHTQKRGHEPINRLYPDDVEMGSYAAWPWGVSRLIDALDILGSASRIDVGHLAISGCSFAGKMALWSGAMDERIALTIAQEPGGGGAAAWRVSETLGNVETLGRTNYSWFKESMRVFSGENVSLLPMDHHELCALVAPRALLVFGNPDYEWLADESAYVSCVAARKVWEAFGIADRMGYSFADGHVHCALPQEQWPELEAFVDRFLLGKDVCTEVTKAPMFSSVDTGRWIRWQDSHEDVMVTGTNPIITNQFTADPTARVFNGKIYMYPSHDIPSVITHHDGSPWFSMADYHVFSSEDLSTWTDHGVIIRQEDVPWGRHDAYSMWAPDCVEKDGKYYFYFPDARAEGGGFAVGVAVADHPEGPFVCEPEPIRGINGIDPCVLLASDGNAYIFWGNGWCAKLKDNMKELAEDNPRDTVRWGGREFEMVGVHCLKNLPNRQAEGPFAFEHGGYYYLTYPYVREDTEVLAYAMSRNPMGPYEYKGIIMAEHANGCWTNHHSIVNYKGQWYLFYHHNAFSPHFDKNRSAQIERLYFNPDGTIQEVKPTLRGVGPVKSSSKVQIDRYSTIEGAATEYLDTTDYFKGWKTVFAREGDSVCFGDLDFGRKAPKKVRICYRASSDAVIRVGAGDAAADCTLPGTDAWTEASFDMSGKVRGTHDLTVRLCNDAEVEIDWMTFR